MHQITPRALLITCAQALLCMAVGVAAVGLVLLGAIGSSLYALGLPAVAAAGRLAARLPRFEPAPGARAPQPALAGATAGARRGAALPVLRAHHWIIGAAAVAALALPALAPADTSMGTADQLGAAVPLAQGATITGTFSRGDDVDYLSFKVAASGDHLRFTVRNTTGKCNNSSSQLPCPIWATLLNGNAQQVGGEGSSAGTSQTDAGTTQVIDWTFSDPGTYYVAMDSAGDNPSYAISYAVIPPAPALARLTATSPQHGTAVRASATVDRPNTKLVAKLTLRSRAGASPAGAAVGRLAIAKAAGTRTLIVKLNAAGRAALKKARKLSLKLRVTATPVTGAPVTKTRLLTLKP